MDSLLMEVAEENLPPVDQVQKEPAESKEEEVNGVDSPVVTENVAELVIKVKSETPTPENGTDSNASCSNSAGSLKNCSNFVCTIILTVVFILLQMLAVNIKQKNSQRKNLIKMKRKTAQPQIMRVQKIT